MAMTQFALIEEETATSPQSATKRYLTKADMDAISPTSTHGNPDGLITCEFCGKQVLRTVWVNTRLRAVQVSDACSVCDYGKFEPWQIQPEEK
jgi:hypothetical protein